MTQKTDKIIFIIGMALVGILMCFVFVYAGVETVKDDNDGNKGYILINTGNQNGQSDVGHWTDPSSIPSLKGEKGDKGEQGIQGIQGIQGLKGNQGEQGNNGYTPIKNVDYFDGKDGKNGLDGLNGIKGDKGDKGNTGENGKDIDPILVNDIQNDITNVENLVNVETDNRIVGDNNLNTKIDNTNKIVNNHSSILQDHENRLNNLDNRVSKLERTQYVAEAEFRVYDSKRLTISPFFRQNFTRGMVDTVGVRFTIKLGSSYEEREIAKTNARLDRTEERLSKIEQKLGQPAYIEKTVTLDKNGKILKRSWHITPQSQGLAVNGEF